MLIETPNPRTASTARLAAVGGRLLPWSLGFSVALLALPLAAQEVRTAQAIRQLPPQEAARGLPVQVEGVITFFDQRTPIKAYQFVQDSTAGIYFYLNDGAVVPPLSIGEKVRVRGITGRGEFAPIIFANRVEALGPGVFPEARPVSYEQLISGQEDSQFVEIQGVVRSVSVEDPGGSQLLEITTGGGRLSVVAPMLPVARGEHLVDSTVKVRGVCATQFNARRQLFDIRLLVPRREDLILVEAAPTAPEKIPVRSIGSLLQFSPQGVVGRRAKVVGTVTCQLWGRALFIDNGQEGLQVLSRQRILLRPGDRVEVLGFPALGEYSPLLQDALYHKIGSEPPPKPARLSLDEVLRGAYDCRLVQLEARLLDRSRQGSEQILVLESDGLIFQAVLDQPPGDDVFATFENGSLVSVTGVCRIAAGRDWYAGQTWRAKSFRLLLRDPGDVVVLEAPPWWTLKRLLWAVGLLGGVILGAFVWVGVLRRRVQQQTKIIQLRLQTEAALKERYLELFENANDMVFTHDLEGRLTSINAAGERLLQRRRAEILGRTLPDLIVEEERAEARHWLATVIQGAELPAAEWDFLDASGQRLKLEISSRLVPQAGRQVEVEGIARDITERKRLEREILEISNREQRRIGHDLHDGVCQQLAGISLLTGTLADRLEEQGVAEAAEAEKIGALINEANRQTRGVARGLFPVRLEENGLVSALEELARNMAELFKLDCRFVCEQPPARVEDSSALHLYYIAQEAVLNAAKHGHARHVTLTLAPARDRYGLSIRDDGVGFVPMRVGRSGMGIRIMQYRARVIGATLELQSQPEYGTEIACLFHPLTH